MSRLRTNLRPVLALGIAPNRFGGMGRALDVAVDSEFRALDLDLRSSFALPRVDALVRSSVLHSVRIRSIWLPELCNGLFAPARFASFESLLNAAKDRLGLRNLVLPRHNFVEGKSYSLAPLARSIADQRYGSLVRIALGLRAKDFQHNRWHLDQLRSIRRLAEEWDLDLALDLTGNVSPVWEAEAAIMCVLPRLTMVRVGAWRHEHGSVGTSVESTMATRTLAILADQGFDGTISLSTSVRSAAAAGMVLALEQVDIDQQFAGVDMALRRWQESIAEP